jgi:hypothetical protein
MFFTCFLPPIDCKSLGVLLGLSQFGTLSTWKQLSHTMSVAQRIPNTSLLCWFWIHAAKDSRWPQGSNRLSPSLGLYKSILAGTHTHKNHKKGNLHISMQRLPCFIPCVKGGVQKCHMTKAGCRNATWCSNKIGYLKQGTLNFEKPEHPDCQEVASVLISTSPNLSTKINFTRPNASGEDQMTVAILSISYSTLPGVVRSLP